MDTSLINKILILFSGLTILIITLYGLILSVLGYTTEGVITIGEALVSIEWPLDFFAKPVTYLSFGIICFIYNLLHYYKNQITKLSIFSRNIILFICFIFIFGAGYEVLYNFTVWGALMSAEAISGYINPDFLNIAYPNPNTPWNLVFATKIFLAIFTSSIYSFYFFTTNQSQK